MQMERSLMELIHMLQTEEWIKKDPFTDAAYADLDSGERQELINRQIDFIMEFLVTLQDIGVSIDIFLDTTDDTVSLKLPGRTIRGMMLIDLFNILRTMFPLIDDMNPEKQVPPHLGGSDVKTDGHILCLDGTVVREGALMVVEGGITEAPADTPIRPADEPTFRCLYTGKSPFLHTRGAKLFKLGTFIKKGTLMKFYAVGEWIDVQSLQDFYITPSWRYYYGE